MNKQFTIEMCGDVNFEGMVIDISYNRETIASINYEKGIDRIEIEVFPAQNEKFIFPIDDFVRVLEKARTLAVKCAKEDIENRKKGIEY